MKKSLKTLLTLVLIAVVFLALSSLFGGLSVNVTFAEDELKVYASKDFYVTAEYDRIKSVELLELPEDLGSIVTGGENRRFSWGERESEAFGKHSLYISKKIDAAVKVTTVDDQIIIFNYESDKTTASIVEMFNGLLANRMPSQ